MNKKLEIRNFFLITVSNLVQMQSLNLSEHLLIDYQSLKDFQLFILQYIKKKTEK